MTGNDTIPQDIFANAKNDFFEKKIFFGFSFVICVPARLLRQSRRNSMEMRNCWRGGNPKNISHKIIIWFQLSAPSHFFIFRPSQKSFSVPFHHIHKKRYIFLNFILVANMYFPTYLYALCTRWRKRQKVTS